MASSGRIISLVFPLLTKSSKYSPFLNACFTYYGRKFISQPAQLLSVSDSIKSPISEKSAQDLLLEKLKSSTSSESVLKLVGAHHSIMNHNHVLEALQTLTMLQKRETSLKAKLEIVNSPEFIKLCHRLKVHSRALALHETIGALKAMCHMNVPSTSPIVQILLQLIRHRVNELVPGQIVYVDVLLSKMNKSPLLEALRIALPLLFEAKLHTSVEDEDTSPSYLADLLSYASRREVSTESIQKLLNSLSRPKTLEQIEVRAAQSVIISLCSKQVMILPIKSVLISHCLEVISNSFHHCSKFELDAITSGLAKACSKGYTNFYSEDFIDAYINYTIRCDVGLVQAIWNLKKLSKMSHVHVGLLEYVAKNVESSPSSVEDGSAGLLICLVTGFSHANYKPKNWDIIEDAILKNEHLKTGKLELPWLKFAAELASMGCFSTPLLQRIFQEEFLKKFLSREYNMLDMLQLLLLNQAVKTLYPSFVGPYPPEDVLSAAARINGSNVERYVLKNSLERGLGGSSYVHQGLRTRLGHFIDHVVVMRKGGYPVALNLQPKKDCCVEDLNMPSDSFVIAILLMPASCYSVNCTRLKGLPSLTVKTLEALNYSVIPVSYTAWTGMPDNEKIPYLMQAIKLKCEENAALEATREGIS